MKELVKKISLYKYSIEKILHPLHHSEKKTRCNAKKRVYEVYTLPTPAYTLPTPSYTFKIKTAIYQGTFQGEGFTGK